jgi:hypothetical protein
MPVSGHRGKRRYTDARDHVAVAAPHRIICAGVLSVQAESRSRMKALLRRPSGRSAGRASRRRLMIAALLVTCAAALATAGSAAAEPPANTSLPTVSGDAVEGETLTSTDGTWTGSEPLTISRQWQRSNPLGEYDGIPGATTTAYTLTSDDVGHAIRLRVVAINTDGIVDAFSAPTVTVASQPSMRLLVSRRPEVYRRATVRAEGSTDSPLKLWVYENLRRGECPATPADRTQGMRALMTDVEVDGDFSEKRRPRMKNPGRHAYCAYLGPDEDTAEETSFANRRVRKPLLTEARAERTVATALNRHSFAGRVVGNLQESCQRRSRNEFQCRFTSAFPGYFLSGLGPVVLKRRLAYRFQVSVSGRSLGLTHENEGGFPR